jgi:hypothetical protein
LYHMHERARAVAGAAAARVGALSARAALPVKTSLLLVLSLLPLTQVVLLLLCWCCAAWQLRCALDVVQRRIRARMRAMAALSCLRALGLVSLI